LRTSIKMLEVSFLATASLRDEGKVAVGNNKDHW